MMGADGLNFNILFAFWRFYFKGKHAFRAKGRLKLVLGQVIFIIKNKVEIFQGFLNIQSVDRLRKTMRYLHSFLILFY